MAEAAFAREPGTPESDLVQATPLSRLGWSTIRETTHELQDAIRRLLHEPENAAAPLRNLARRIAFDVAAHADPTLVVPSSWTASDPSDVSGRPIAGGGADLVAAFVHAGGLDAARLLAWLGPAWRLPADRLEWLTLAGLLHDVGWLVGRGRRAFLRGGDADRGRTRQSIGSRFPEHPSIGAAIVGDLVGAPVDFAEWIAQHHERCDGTGFPRKLLSSQLRRPARMLALVVRLIELLGPSPEANRSGAIEIDRAAVVTSWRHALDRLNREAMIGEFDAELFAAAKSRLVAGQPDLSPDRESPVDDDCPLGPDDEDLRRRRDEAQSVPGPHRTAIPPAARPLRSFAHHPANEHDR